MRSHDGAAPPRTRLTLMAVLLMAAAPARNLLLDPAAAGLCGGGAVALHVRFHRPHTRIRDPDMPETLVAVM